jgi:hypothetical protein
MKNLLVILLLSSICCMAYAQTCPLAKDIIVNGRVVPPPGWKVAKDERKTSLGLGFSVAAWGDHKHNTDSVRCYYYNGYKDHVELETVYLLPESSFSSHAEWGKSGEHYYLCNNTSESKCPFN